MNTRRLVRFSALLLAGTALPAQEGQPPQTQPPPERPETKKTEAAPAPGSMYDALLREGDAHYRQRQQIGMADKAIASYRKAIALDEVRVDAYWRMAKAHYWLANRERDEETRAKILKEGIEFAKMGVAADDKSVAAHFWLGVMYGSYGQAVGIFQSLHMVEPIKSEMQRVIAADEKFDEGGAHRVLGRLYDKLPGFKGGDKAAAKRHLLRAVELGPKNTLNYLFLAEFYLDQGDRTQARKALETLLEQPDDPDYLPETKEQKEQARKLLEDIR